jgi:hypothetical protein
MGRAELMANRKRAGVGYIWCFAPCVSFLDRAPARNDHVTKGSLGARRQRLDLSTGSCRLL